MGKRAVLRKILEVGVIPIVRTQSASLAMNAVEAIYNSGIPVLEITMTVRGAIKTLEEACDRFGDSMVLGAGTVLDPTTARNCMLAGADFIVTPCLDVKTVEMCNRYSKVAIPGALTPTEIMTAWDAGASMVKVFPVSAMGGPGYIKAVKAPLPHVKLVPTGGVSLENAPDFIRAGASAVAIGSNLVNKRWVSAREFGRIEAAARDLMLRIAKSRAA